METFSVYWFDPDGNSYPELVFVDARAAMEKAASLARRPTAVLGIIKRIIVTDSGDCIAFEWKHGEGVTFPLECRGAQPR